MSRRAAIWHGRLIAASPWLIRAAVAGWVLSLGGLAALVWRGGAGRMPALPAWAWGGGLALAPVAWSLAAARIWLLTRGLGQRLSYGRAALIALAAEFGAGVTPAGLGGMLTRVWGLRRAGLPTGTALRLVAADALLDIAWAALVALAALRSAWFAATPLPVPASLRHGVGAAVMPVLLGVGGLLVLFAARAALRRRTATGLPRGGGLWLAAAALACAFQWTCRYGILPLLLRAQGIAPDWSLTLAAQGLLFFLGNLLVLPGGGGGVEAGAALLFGLWLAPARVPGAVLVWRLLTFHLYLAAGGWALCRLAGAAPWRAVNTILTERSLNACDDSTT